MGKWVKLVMEVILTIVAGFLLALLLQKFVLEPRIIPTGSMQPTIDIQNRVLVNKFIYKYTSPKMGDIIIFSPPPSTGKKEDFIKRVIGVAGDKVEVRDGKVLVNEKVINENYIFENPHYTFGPVYVPENSLFVMGDNRNNSFDSHLWHSWLTLDQVKGKAFCIYWPMDYFRRL